MNGRLMREAVSTTNCTLSAPCWWPRNRLRARLPAQRPFPSIMMATCCGILTGSSCRYIAVSSRSEEHTSELQSLRHLVCRLLLEKTKRHHVEENNDGALRRAPASTPVTVET